MKRIIITGATSMLGLALTNECLANGTQVYAFIRKHSQKRKILPKSAQLIQIECEISEYTNLQISDIGFDAFYHFAWGFTENKDRNRIDEQLKNIEYTLDAVKLAYRLNCKQFIGAGSQAEYGRVNGTISPDTRVSPDSAYGIAKYTAGRFGAKLCEQIGLHFIWTRIFSTYGIGDMPSTMIMYCIDRLLKGKKPSLTKCEQKWDYLNCRDAAKAFFQIGQKGKNQMIYNIGSGIARPLSDYVYMLRDAIDKTAPLGIGEHEYSPYQIMHLCADINTLYMDTGFCPTISFEEGIKETINWYKNTIITD
jgi:nucleoside-diphosphate-sugar epimerase